MLLSTNKKPEARRPYRSRSPPIPKVGNLPVSMIDSSNYTWLGQIGEGATAKVYKTIEEKTGRHLAMKMARIDVFNKNFHANTLRELNVLTSLNHANVLAIYGMCKSRKSEYNGYKSEYFFILELCEVDLCRVLWNEAIVVNPSDAKHMMKQFLEALTYIHERGIIHRDIKPHNVMINIKGVLKLADFGSSRYEEIVGGDAGGMYTGNVVAMWYRPPEILLGDQRYGTSIDMWSAGCVMGEMFTRFPILQGGTEKKQLKLIEYLCGSITSKEWPDVEKLPLYKANNFDRQLQSQLRDRFSRFTMDYKAIHLLNQLLSLDPNSRMTAPSALQDKYFTEAEMLPNRLDELVKKMVAKNEDKIDSLFILQMVSEW